MGALKCALVALSLGWAAPAGAQVERWAGYIAEASERFQIPSAWVRRVMAAESAGRTMLNGRPIESSAGAMGLMQLMPGTWREMRTRLGLGPDPHEPRDNILAGTAYLRLMYERFGYPGLFAAYNAGPARYANHLATGRRLPAETVSYVAQVGRGVPARAADTTDSSGSPPAALFVVQRASAPASEASDRADLPPSPGMLFVRLRDGAAGRE